MNKYNKVIATALFLLFLTTSLFAADIKQMATSKIATEKAKVANKVTSFVKDTIQDNFQNTEVSITGMEDAKPQWEIITVQPIRDTGDDLTFFKDRF